MLEMLNIKPEMGDGSEGKAEEESEACSSPEAEKEKEAVDDSSKMTCPECGSTSLVFEGGCVSCSECGWTKCE